MERIQTINQAIKYLTQKSLRSIGNRITDLRRSGFDVAIEEVADVNRRRMGALLRKMGYSIVPKSGGMMVAIKWDIEKIITIIKYALLTQSGVNEAYMFTGDPVSVQLKGRIFPPTDIWGMVVDNFNKLLLMDSDQIWHEITTEDINAYAVLTTLYMHPLTKNLFRHETANN